MKLPLELRLEIFRYLLPSRAIGSSTSLLHIDEDSDQQQPWYHSMGPARAGPAFLQRQAHTTGNSPLDRSIMRSVFPIPFTNLLLINRQIHDEVKDFLYSTIPFTVDVRKDGTFMCGRRLLEPRRADGSSHYVVGDVEKIKEKFLKTFDWAAVKNYNVDILVENWKDDTNRGYHTFPWDEEVEIYDIRDYIGVVISGILSKARNLCRLNVRLGFSKFIWTEEELRANIKTLVGPFQRLRNVRQPRLLGVYEGTPQTNFMISLPVPGQAAISSTPVNGSAHCRPSTPLCSVPQLPVRMPLLICTTPAFMEYRKNWERWIASGSTTSLVSKPPIRTMFTELKEFYTRLAATVPDVTARNGRHAFLHRARVAREQENVEAFRHLRNELIGYWEAYLEQEERKKDDMNRRLGRMLDVDVYPASWDEDHACIVGLKPNVTHSMPSSSSSSPIITNADSWVNATKRLQLGRTGTTSLIQDPPQCQVNSSRCDTGISVQDPVGIDPVDENGHHRGNQHIEHVRPLVITQSCRQPQQNQNVSLQSPTRSDGQISPGSFQATLQQSKDQQPMALNPQLHLEAAMSHRRQVELQAHQARAMHEAARRQMVALARAEARDQALVQAEAQAQQNPAFSPTVMHPQRVTMPQFPMHHMPGQSQAAVGTAPDLADLVYVPPSPPVEPSSSSSSASPPNDHYLPNHTPSTYANYPAYPFHLNVTIPNAEPAVHVYDGAPHKRPIPGDQEAEITNGKRQRVDSGLGWTEGESEEGEDVILPTDYERGIYRETANQTNVGYEGKGKARADVECGAWVNWR